MSRVFEFGGSDFKETQKIDLHDEGTPLKVRLAFAFLFLPGGVNCDDFNCTESELERAAQEIEKDPDAFEDFAKKTKEGKLKRRFNNPKQKFH